jgi:hypothetical protein
MTSITVRLTAIGLLGAGLTLAAGCTRPTALTSGKQSPQGHDHAEKGPHGGLILEWGDHEMHAELVFDRAKKQATVYVWDHDLKKHVPIKAEAVKLTLTHESPPVEVQLKAEPAKGDPEGKASKFVGTHDKLAEKSKFKGKVGWDTYSDKFAEK